MVILFFFLEFLQDRDYQQSPHNYRSTMRLEGQIRKLQEDMEQKQKVTRVSWNTLRGNPVGRPPSPSLISGWSEFESAGAGTQVFDEDDDDDDDDIVVLEHIPPNPHKRKQPLDECIETKRQKKDSPAEDGMTFFPSNAHKNVRMNFLLKRYFCK